jgi:hypothetical protein
MVEVAARDVPSPHVASELEHVEGPGGMRLFVALLGALQLAWLALIGYCISSLF